MTANKLLDLAKFDFVLRRLQFPRWIVKAVLFIFLILALTGSTRVSPVFFGLFFIVLPVEVVLDLFGLFLRQEISRIESLQATKGEGMTYQTALLLVTAKNKPKFLWHYLLRDSSVRFVLVRLAVNPEQLETALPTPPAINEWFTAAKQMAKNEKVPVSPKHLFEVLQGYPDLAVIWDSLGISFLERANVWGWYGRLEHQIKLQQRGFINQVSGSGGIGRDWASGYTHALDQFALDLSREFERTGSSMALIGHAEERAKIIEYLARDQKHNVVMVGEDGIGKHRLLYTLAAELNKGTLPAALKHKHLYILDVGRIISGGNQEQIDTRLRAVFNEAIEVGNVILAVPDFELLVGAQGNKTIGVIDASGVLTEYLQAPGLQFMATITPSGYYTYIDSNATLKPYLLPVEMKEMQSLEALQVLEDDVFRVEAKSNHIFTYQSLAKIIEICEQNVHDKPYPEKAIDLLDEVSGAIVNSPQKLVLASQVEAVISEKLKIPIGKPGVMEKEVLNNLESLIRERIVGQEEAVKVVANALRRARAGLHSGKRPIGSFLFLGPTGVGKTEMAKTIAAIYYKNDKAFVRVDMSEYQTPDSIEKLIGSRSTPGLLTTAITDQPFSVVLLDEIEKADAGIRNLFLQILDDGHITDGYGRKVDFTNAMVVATSNAGAQLIREAVQSGKVDANFRQQLLDYLQTQGVFAPEWLNRFDAIVTFMPLSEAEIRKVAELQVADLVEKLKTHNINLTINPDVYDVLIQKGYDPQFGARPMRRAVQDVIESALAKVLLNDTSEAAKEIILTKDMILS